MEARIRVRMAARDAHYSGNLVDGAKVLELYGDAATELCIRADAEEGLLRAYSSVDFLAPVYAGDFIEAVARIVKIGNRSRAMEFEAYKLIEADPEGSGAVKVLDPPLLVGRARGTCVVAAKPAGVVVTAAP
jgi:3-aminobutyryl-CoA ammonia-lyase